MAKEAATSERKVLEGLIMKKHPLIAALAVTAILPVAGCSSFKADIKAGMDSARDGTYKGTDLAADVVRTVQANGATVTGVTCADTPKIAKDVITDCKATMDGKLTGIRVTFNDAQKHFTLTQQAI
jgi:hypothetical protein